MKKDENLAFEDGLFVRSFLDGRQRTVLFCESAAAIDRTVNVAELEKMDLEVTASLKGTWKDLWSIGQGLTKKKIPDCRSHVNPLLDKKQL